MGSSYSCFQRKKVLNSNVPVAEVVVSDKIKLVNFQLQIQSSESAKDFIQMIDSKAPIPQPLEGGDGNGALYECMLDSNYRDILLDECNKTKTIRIYGLDKPYARSFEVMEFDRSIYRGDYYVQWDFGKKSSIVKKPYWKD